jgi:pimeloyl-ACP methyl ester carboxylesterase
MSYAISHDGKKLWYDVIGKGDPLVLIGGSSLIHRQWDFMVPFLKDHFQVILHDQRGAGLSDRSPEGITVDAWANDIKAILDGAGIQRTHLMGTSNGSFPVIKFAARYPERTGAIIHYGMFRITDQSRKMWRIGAAICDEFGVGNGSMGAYFLVRLFGMASSYEAWETQCFEEHLLPESWKAMHRAMDVDLTEDVKKIKAPQMLLVGDSGSLGKDSEYGAGWKAVKELCPDTEIAVIAGAEGTYCVVTHPADVSSKVIRFLKKHPIGS